MRVWGTDIKAIDFFLHGTQTASHLHITKKMYIISKLFSPASAPFIYILRKGLIHHRQHEED